MKQLIIILNPTTCPLDIYDSGVFDILLGKIKYNVLTLLIHV